MRDFRYAVVDPARVAGAGVAVVVPARNEADNIATCLASLARQDIADRIAVYLCVNNTFDDTADIALGSAREMGLAMVVAKGPIGRGGVGMARRIGHALAHHHSPLAGSLLSTDADCIADPAWARLIDTALSRAPAALGRIDTAPGDRDKLPARYHDCARIEATYAGLSAEFEHLLSARKQVGIGLNTAGGANMGVRADIYRRVGGFHPLTSGEDRNLIDRIRRARHDPVRVPGAIVCASTRSQGRAPRGMASAIRERSGLGEIRLDTALVPFPSMLARHMGLPTLATPVTLAQAMRDMPELRDCVSALKSMARLSDRHRYAATLGVIDPAVGRGTRQ